MPHIYQGGVGQVTVMPNLKPSITSTDAALAYQAKLLQEESHTQYLISLYLHQDLTPDEVIRAKHHGVRNIKLYPMGVTTNSAEGVS